MKAFDKLLAHLNGRLPDVVIESLPSILSEEMKNQLLQESPETVAAAINAAIDEINHGSVERIEVLVKRWLSNR